MESPRDSAKRIIRSRAFLFLVVILLVVAMISVAMGGSESHEEDDLKAKASASGTLFRTDETIQFTAEGSSGHIDTYLWVFGDRNTGNGSDVSHSYERGGWYNVTLTVTCASGNTDTAMLVVGVQPEDQHSTRNLERDRDLRPLWAHGFGLLGFVGPHIEPPTTHMEYDVTQAVGTFYIYVEVWVIDEDTVTTTDLHQEEYTMTGGDIHFSYTVGPEDLPEEAATKTTQVHVSGMIDQGRWTSSEIKIDVEFPFDEFK